MEEKDSKEPRERSFQVTVSLDEKTYTMLARMCEITGRARSRICARYIQVGLVDDARELADFEEAMIKLAKLYEQ